MKKMNGRQAYLVPEFKGDNEAIYHILRYVGDCLDNADAGFTSLITPGWQEEFSNGNLANNWMLVAFLIADATEISTPKLIEIANSVFKGEQVALKF